MQTVAAIPRGRSFDPTPLLGGEREFPATTPEWTEFGVWYLWSVAGILLASVLAALTAVAQRICRRPTTEPGTATPAFLEKTIFWLTIVVVGTIGSPLLNRWQSEYVFLWPMVLWAALQLTLLSTVWAERQPNRNGARWISRLAGATFFAVSGLYFHLCRRLGLSIEWGYLSGLLPAFPFVALAAWEHLRPSRFRRWMDPLCAIGSFTAYFASVAVFIKWWLRVGS